MNIPERYNLDLSNFIHKFGPDQLRPHMYHEPELIEFTEHGVKLKTQHIHRNNSGQVAAVSSIRGSGFSYGVYEFEAKLPAGHGNWPAVWLLNGRTEIDLLEGKPRKCLGYFDPGIRGMWRVYADFHRYTYHEDGTKETESLQHKKLSLGWRNPARWQRYCFTVHRSSISLDADWKDGAYIKQIIYSGDLDLHGPLDLYITNWVWPHAVRTFQPGTFEVRNFKYLPFV